MKSFLKFVGGIFLTIYVLVAVLLTVLLLNYNDYGVTVLGDYTLIPLEDKSLEPMFKKGDLIIVKKDVNNTRIGDSIFFYQEDYDEKTITINLAKVLNTRKITDKETTFTIDGNYEYSSEYVIGSSKDAKVYHSVGAILKLLESRWIFLIFIILPILFIFLYEIYEFILEVKRSLKEV